MPLSRAVAAEDIADDPGIGDLLALAQIVPADVRGGLRFALDAAFRAGGTTADLDTAEVDDAGAEAFLDRAKHAALEAVVFRLARRTTGADDDLRDSPVFRQAKSLLDLYAARVARWRDTEITTGSITFGILEPQAEEWAF